MQDEEAQNPEMAGPAEPLQDVPDDSVDVTVRHEADQLQEMLEQERARSAELEGKLKRALADYQNLERQTRSEIQHGVQASIDELLLDFLQVYDDFVRARDALADTEAPVEGLESILKNMDALLQRYGVAPIPAKGQAFDPNMHEAISVIADPGLPDGTITKEIRKGYICKDRVIRPSLVEISKNEGE